MFCGERVFDEVFEGRLSGIKGLQSWTLARKFHISTHFPNTHRHFDIVERCIEIPNTTTQALAEDILSHLHLDDAEDLEPWPAWIQRVTRAAESQFEKLVLFTWRPSQRQSSPDKRQHDRRVCYG